MATRISGTEHQLTGDWTISGVVEQCEVLSRSLQYLNCGRKKRLHIDCGKISSIDMSGLQLIHVWMELIKMRGVEAELLNLPDDMQYIIRRLGLGQPHTDDYPDVA